MKTAPDIEALHQLIRVLEQVEALPAERFDMSHYRQQINCGFSACAYGHALFDPWFMSRHNVEWVLSSSNRIYGSYIPQFDGAQDDVVTAGYMSAPGQRDLVFGLTHQQFGRLFMPEAYDEEEALHNNALPPHDTSDFIIRPRHVIAQVRQLLTELATQKEEEDNG